VRIPCPTHSHTHALVPSACIATRDILSPPPPPLLLALTLTLNPAHPASQLAQPFSHPTQHPNRAARGWPLGWVICVMRGDGAGESIIASSEAVAVLTFGRRPTHLARSCCCCCCCCCVAFLCPRSDACVGCVGNRRSVRSASTSSRAPARLRLATTGTRSHAQTPHAPHAARVNARDWHPTSCPFLSSPFLSPFFPLSLRIRQGGGPSNPILPAARARSVPKIPLGPSTPSTPVSACRMPHAVFAGLLTTYSAHSGTTSKAQNYSEMHLKIKPCYQHPPTHGPPL
jgi:hypothetical protein